MSDVFFYSVIMNAMVYLLRYTMILLVVKIFSSRFSFLNASSKSNVAIGQKFISNNVNNNFADINDNDTQSPITIDKLMYFDNINDIINFEPIIAIKQKDKLMYLAFKNIKAKDICLNIDNQKIYFKPRLIVWREKNQNSVRLFKKYASLINDEDISVLKGISKAQKTTILLDNSVKAITPKDKSLLIRMLRVYLS